MLSAPDETFHKKMLSWPIPESKCAMLMGDHHLSFRLANVHVDELGAFHAEEIDIALGCNSFGHQGLPCSYSHKENINTFFTLVAAKGQHLLMDKSACRILP